MTERHFPSGILCNPNGEGEIRLSDTTGRIFGHYTLKEKHFYGEPLYGAVIRNLKKNYLISYRFDESFTHLVVWNKTGEDGFICIEPQTCAINAYNIDKPDSITGRRTLDGGAVFITSTKVSLKECEI
jgi:aldose 1-epimerase